MWHLNWYYLNDLTLTLLLIHHPFLNVKRHQGASNMQKVPICTRHRDREGGEGGRPTTYSSLPMGGKSFSGWRGIFPGDVSLSHVTPDCDANCYRVTPNIRKMGSNYFWKSILMFICHSKSPLNIFFFYVYFIVCIRKQNDEYQETQTSVFLIADLQGGRWLV